jgi:signal transduction histidine kinase/ActR/RegA family two-component response regulator
VRSCFRSLWRRILEADVSRKILLLSALCSGVTMFPLSVLVFLRDIQTFHFRKADQLASVAGVVASSTEAALTFRDPLTAEESLRALEREPDLLRVVLYDHAGAVFASFDRFPSTEPPSLPEQTGATISFGKVQYVHAVRNDHGLLGSLVLEADNRAVRAQFINSLLLSLGVFAGGMAVTLLLAARFRGLITEPLENLARLAYGVSHDQDYSRRAKKRYDDEIGSLVDSFNLMLESIRQRDEALRASHRSLERKVSERTAELRDAMEQAQAASRAKSDFLATMSHELRTPMNAIVGVASIMCESSLDEENRSRLELVRQSSDTLLGLITDVLDYSKIESGQLDLEDAPFSLRECVENAMEMVAAQRRQAGVRMITSFDPTIPDRVRGDLLRVRQILVNLLGNAAKFTEQGHVWIEVRSQNAEAPADRHRVEFAVHDTGIGIPQDRLDRLFKSFSQVDSTTTRRFGGTGLGLAISRRLAEAMGGEISVESAFGLGSTFRVFLPLAEVSDHSETVHGPPPWSLSEAAPKVALLGLPDPLRGALAKVLQSWGATVETPGDVGEMSAEWWIAGLYEADWRAQWEAWRPTLEATPLRGALITPASLTPELRTTTRGLLLSDPVRVEELRQFFRQGVSPPAEEGTVSGHGADAEDEPMYAGMRVLLAEDNRVNQRVFRIMAERLRLSLTIADDGAEAVSMVMRQPFDVVFMDFQMPTMDGLEATRRIRALGEKVEQPWIIGFTANVQSAAEPEMRAVGMDDYVSKPVKFPALQAALERHQQSQPAMSPK